MNIDEGEFKGKDGATEPWPMGAAATLNFGDAGRLSDSEFEDDEDYRSDDFGQGDESDEQALQKQEKSSESKHGLDHLEKERYESKAPTRSELRQVELLRKLSAANRAKQEKSEQALRQKTALRIKAREAVIGKSDGIMSRLLVPKRKNLDVRAFDGSESEREQFAAKKEQAIKLVKRNQIRGPDPKQLAFLNKLAEEKRRKEAEAQAKAEKEQQRKLALVQSARNIAREANARRKIELEKRREQEEEQKLAEEEQARLAAPKVPLVPGVWQKHVDSIENDEEKRFEARRNLDRTKWAMKNGISPETPVFYCSKMFPAIREELARRGWYENLDRESSHWDLLITVRLKPILDKGYSDSQIVNRFIGSGALCTKGGLAQSLSSLQNYVDDSAMSFFPRCYNLSIKSTGEVHAFAEDFCVTAAERLLKVLQRASACAACGAGQPARCSCEEKRQVRASPALIRTAAWVCYRFTNRFDDDYVDAETRFVAPVVSSVEWALIKSADPEKLTIKDSLLSVFRQFSRSGNADRLWDLFASTTTDLTKVMSPENGVSANNAYAEEFLSSMNERQRAEYKDAEAKAEARLQKDLKRYAHGQIRRLTKEDEAGELDAQVVGDDTIAHALEALERLQGHRPQSELNGAPGANCWIVKPADKSRGRGIACFNSLEKIVKYTRLNSQETSKWVVQKYMENSLIVHRRKFDIRQWVMVTSWNPLTVYFYDDCYLRFCVNEYTMDEEALEDRFVHLANNSISKHSKKFDETPIEGNMWRRDQFIDYIEKELRNGAQGTGQQAWDTVIKPGLQNIAIKTMASVQEQVQHRDNSFEIFGFDFMLDDNLKPWLIEVNCSPSMEYSTQITEELVSDALASSMAVVLDAKYDCDDVATDWINKTVRTKPKKGADTGKWNLIHCADPIKHQLGPATGFNDLSIQAKAVPKPKGFGSKNRKLAAERAAMAARAAERAAANAKAAKQKATRAEQPGSLPNHAVVATQNAVPRVASIAPRSRVKQKILSNSRIKSEDTQRARTKMAVPITELSF